MSDLKTHLFSAKGRLGRWDWFVWTIGLGFAGAVAREVETLPLGWIPALLLYPKACLHAKRLHDLGLGAWWQAPAFLVSVAVLYFGDYETLGRAIDAALQPWPLFAQAALALPLVSALLAYWAMLAFARGQAGANLYGPSPISTSLAGERSPA